jgi:hypothetical protein
MSPEARQQLLVATKSAAAAFIEDMAYFRDLLNRKEIKADEIRRSSGELRRLLIDNGGDLEKIAPPRIGRVYISAPYNNPYYRAIERTPVAFFASGGVTLFGATFRTLILNAGTSMPRVTRFDPERTESVTIDQFLSQKVLSLKGRWVTRRLLIKYVANVAHGVHSGTAKDDNEKLVEQIRRVITCGAPPHAALIEFHTEALREQKETPAFRYEPKSIDIALVELLATMHFLAMSPGISELERVVSAELAT